jgi:ribulose-5-phosphate 4-epimerase/fuculose-1-phosphate aldolase
VSTETELRQAICDWGRSLFERGLTSGSSGNISVRTSSGYIITPTNSCLGRLDPTRLSALDVAGGHVGGDKPSKEVPLHLAFYEARPEAMAVVHLHSTYATALSCRSDIDPANCLPALTPYVLMRAGKVPLLPYTDPGTADSRPDILRLAPRHASVLLANHGPVVSGANLDAAVYAAEELEEAAKVAFILEGHKVRHLDAATIERLTTRYR